MARAALRDTHIAHAARWSFGGVRALALAVSYMCEIRQWPGRQVKCHDDAEKPPVVTAGAELPSGKSAVFALRPPGLASEYQ